MMRVWLRALSTALLAAAGIGAAQLGLAYGFGVLLWTQDFGPGHENAWQAQLAWAAWISAVAVIAGAVAGATALRRNGLRARFGSWLAVALSAAVGTTLIVPLMTLPAAEAVLRRTSDPVLDVALAAGVGGIAGLVAAFGVLAARLVAGSVYATVAWVWAVALVSASSVLSGETELAAQRLGVLSLPAVDDSLITLVTVGSAVVVAAAIAGYGRWLKENPVVVAFSGLAGPTVLAASYLAAGPGVTADRDAQSVPYSAALIAAGAGLLVSLAIALARKPRPRPKPAAPEEPGPSTEDNLVGVPAPAARTSFGDPATDQLWGEPTGRPAWDEPTTRPAWDEPPPPPTAPEPPAKKPGRASRRAAQTPPPPPAEPSPPPPPPPAPAGRPPASSRARTDDERTGPIRSEQTRAEPGRATEPARDESSRSGSASGRPRRDERREREADEHASWFAALRESSADDDPELAKPTRRGTLNRSTNSDEEATVPDVTDAGKGRARGRAKPQARGRAKPPQADQPK